MRQNVNIDLSWSDFKTKIINISNLRYKDQDTFYYCWYVDVISVFECSILKDSGSDQTDFETNYKNNANQPIISAVVTTQYEVNDKDLKLAKAKQSVDETGTAIASLKVPGTFGSGSGRYVAGGYGISEDYNKDDYALCWIEDDDRNIAWMLALDADPGASAPLDDLTIQGMGVIPGIGISMPNYPIVKYYHDEEVADENKGWYFWANAIGNNVQANGEVEIEPISGYGFIPSGLYIKIKYVRPEGITTGGIRINLFWGKKE